MDSKLNQKEQTDKHKTRQDIVDILQRKSEYRRAALPIIDTFLSLGKHVEAGESVINCPVLGMEYGFRLPHIENLIKFCPGCGKKLSGKAIVWHSVVESLIEVESTLRRSLGQ